MNIFLLDEDLAKNAQCYVDSHVIKMPLESAQLLCSVFYFTGQEKYVPYKLTHKNHPCAVWVRESLQNWCYLRMLALEICKEYTYRYGKTHKCETIIESLILPDLPITFLTQLPSCMDDAYKISNNVIESYRNYYIYGKSHLHKWTKRSVPEWV